jgi:hypothetical protein
MPGGQGARPPIDCEQMPQLSSLVLSTRLLSSAASGSGRLLVITGVYALCDVPYGASALTGANAAKSMAIGAHSPVPAFMRVVSSGGLARCQPRTYLAPQRTAKLENLMAATSRTGLERCPVRHS